MAAPPNGLRLNNYDLTIDSVLGWGASASVYGLSGTGRKKYAAKVAHEGLEHDSALSYEFQTLQDLCGCENIPVAVNFLSSLDNRKTLILEPVGEVMSPEKLDEHSLDIFNWFPMHIIAALKHCHGKGCVHRDVRPANIILVQEEISTKAVLIDWYADVPLLHALQI